MFAIELVVFPEYALKADWLDLEVDSFDCEFLPLVLGLGGGATCCFGRGIAFLGATSDALGSLVTLLDPFL